MPLVCSLTADGVVMYAVLLAYTLGFGTFALFGAYVLSDFFKSKRTLRETVKNEKKI